QSISCSLPHCSSPGFPCRSGASDASLSLTPPGHRLPFRWDSCLAASARDLPAWGSSQPTYPPSIHGPLHPSKETAMQRFAKIAAALAMTTIWAIPAMADDKEFKLEDGFTALFNGMDLNGWEIMNKGQFSVKDGVIYLNKGGGWLRTEKEYKDF